MLKTEDDCLTIKINGSDRKMNFELFLNAQESVYEQVLYELRTGHKESHWIWFIFPNLLRENTSKTSQKYALKNEEEAIEYINHPILGKRLIECMELVHEEFQHPDNLKFESCLRLFSKIDKRVESISQRFYRF